MNTQGLVYDSREVSETLRTEECDLFFAIERCVDLFPQLSERLRVGAEEISCPSKSDSRDG